MNEFNIKNGFISKDNSIVQGSLIATSISAITYYNLPTDIFSGGTVSGETLFTNGVTSNTISATTYYNLPTDIKVTGFTFNNGNYDLTIFNNDNSNFTQSLSILATDMTITGGTYDLNSGEVTFTNNSGGTFNVTGFVTGYTDTFTTGGTYSNGTTIFTKTNGETYSVSGFATTFTGGTVNSLTANTISATTYLNLPINYWSLSGTNIINNNLGNTIFGNGVSYVDASGNFYGNYFYPNTIQGGRFINLSQISSSSALIKYNGDYSSTYDDRTLVDKGYVNNRLVVETTTGYTLTNVDSGGIVIFKATSAQTLTVSTGLTAGFECTFVSLTGVTVTVSSSGNVLNNALGNLLPPQSSFTLKRMLTTNEFIATGNL